MRFIFIDILPSEWEAAAKSQGRCHVGAPTSGGPSSRRARSAQPGLGFGRSCFGSTRRSSTPAMNSKSSTRCCAPMLWTGRRSPACATTSATAARRSTSCGGGLPGAASPGCVMGDLGAWGRSSARRRWWSSCGPSAPPIPRSRFPRSWSGWRVNRTCSCIGGRWSGSSDASEKKTPPLGEDLGTLSRALAGETFITVGDVVQRQYEARRLAFLIWASRDGDRSDPPPGLGAHGLAGLVAPTEDRWILRCVAAPRRPWAGAADSRATALLAAYRLLLGAAAERGPAPPEATPSNEENSHAGGPVCTGLDGAPGAAGDDRLAAGCAAPLRAGTRPRGGGRLRVCR